MELRFGASRKLLPWFSHRHNVLSAQDPRSLALPPEAIRNAGCLRKGNAHRQFGGSDNDDDTNECPGGWNLSPRHRRQCTVHGHTSHLGMVGTHQSSIGTGTVGSIVHDAVHAVVDLRQNLAVPARMGNIILWSTRELCANNACGHLNHMELVLVECARLHSCGQLQPPQAVVSVEHLGNSAGRLRTGDPRSVYFSSPRKVTLPKRQLAQ